MFGYSRTERGGADICDFRGEPQQSSRDQVPVGFRLPQLICGRGQTILFHGALQEIHLPVFKIRRPDKLVGIHRQIRHVWNDKKKNSPLTDIIITDDGKETRVT